MGQRSRESPTHLESDGPEQPNLLQGFRWSVLGGARKCAGFDDPAQSVTATRGRTRVRVREGCAAHEVKNIVALEVGTLRPPIDCGRAIVPRPPTKRELVASRMVHPFVQPSPEVDRVGALECGTPAEDAESALDLGTRQVSGAAVLVKETQVDQSLRCRTPPEAATMKTDSRLPEPVTRRK